jgi:hypothetical protein
MVDITSALLTEAGRDILSLGEEIVGDALTTEMLCMGDAIVE